MDLPAEDWTISPIINNQSEALFFYRGEAESVCLTGEYNRWALEDRMARNCQGIWCIEKTFPINARFEYKYVVDGKWIRDPLNAHPSDLSDNSTLIMPGYRSDYEAILRQTAPEGTLTDMLTLQGNRGDELRYRVYLPPGYEKSRAGSIIYALDGSDYLRFAKIDKILNYLITNGDIPSAVAVLADPGNRDVDYTLHEPHLRLVAGELMPAVESELLAAGPVDRAVIGVSWGGLTAIALALMSPFPFRRVLSQSGSFWPKSGRIYGIVQKTELPPMRFCLQTGTIDDTEEMNEVMARLLNEKGVSVSYQKYAETHNWTNWRGHLDAGLKCLYCE